MPESVEQTLQFERRVADAIRNAIASAGPHKGKLLARCPNSYRDPDAAAAWHALTLEANPLKASVGAIVMMTAEQKRIFNFVLDAVSKSRINCAGLDRDRVFLDSLGVY